MFSDTPSHARAQAADPAHVQVHGHARLRGLVERADAARVHERVHLQHDARVLAALLGVDRPLDLVQEPVAHVVGRDDRLAVLRRARRAGERVEQLGHVGAELAVAREEAEVLVQARRLGVVVAGPDVHVVARSRALAAHHQQRLRVRLQARAGRAPRARPPPRARAPSRCCGARRTWPSAPPGRPPACRARPPRSAPAPGPSRRTCGTRSS